MDKEKMAQQSESTSQLEPVLHWGTLVAKWAALGLGVVTLLSLALRGRRLPQGAQFGIYAAAAVAFWALNRELAHILDSVSE